MNTHLSRDQRALLGAALAQRQQQLARQVAEHHHGLSRADHAREVLLQDGDDAPQRESERELDMALSDRELHETAEVSLALKRLQGDGYGLCAGCGAAIPYARLQAEPWAQRCTACEAAREKSARRSA